MSPDADQVGVVRHQVLLAITFITVGVFLSWVVSSDFRVGFDLWGGVT